MRFSGGTGNRVVDLDLRVKLRDPEASIRVALRDVRCPRCNGHGHPRRVTNTPEAHLFAY
jgi:hypothetical protein